MQVLQSTLLVVLSLALSMKGAEAVECTALQEEQHSASWDELHTMCDYILGSSFKTCSDECYTHFKSVAAAAPNCSQLGFDTTVKQLDELFVTRCEDARGNASSTYTPRTQPGLANCSSVDENAWERKYGYTSPVSDCKMTFMTAKTCSDQCLAMIEEGVEAAKVCQLQYDYSSRELKKMDLVGCLKARGEDLKTNELLQSMGSSQNTSTTNTSSSATETTPAPTTTTVSSASATALSIAIGVGSIVLAVLSL